MTISAFDQNEAVHLSIAEMGRKYCVTARALRFYEEKNVINPLRCGRARRYRPDDCRRLALILNAKGLGFTLEEIREMIPAFEGHTSSDTLALTRQRCLDQIRHLDKQRAKIDAAIIALEALAEKAR